MAYQSIHAQPSYETLSESIFKSDKDTINRLKAIALKNESMLKVLELALPYIEGHADTYEDGAAHRLAVAIREHLKTT